MHRKQPRCVAGLNEPPPPEVQPSADEITEQRLERGSHLPLSYGFLRARPRPINVVAPVSAR
jgi:hypothetical protein